MDWITAWIGCPALTIALFLFVERFVMPEISRFFGIVIKMFFNDHDPAHFHAEYSGEEALIEIETLEIYRGRLPRRVMALVLEWAALHRKELRAGWCMAREGRPIPGIVPLDEDE